VNYFAWPRRNREWNRVNLWQAWRAMALNRCGPVFPSKVFIMLELLVLCSTFLDGPIRERLRELKPEPPPPAKTLSKANTLLSEVEDVPKAGIPESLLAKAEGVVIIPDTVKAGFILAGRGGHGVALIRDEDGNWGDPTFVNLGGVSFGPQLGLQTTDLVLVFKKKKSLERILDGKSKLTLGVDAGVAAGPVGRRAEASTDGQMKAEVLSYSKSRGLFAGLSMDGGILTHSDSANKEFKKEPTKETVIESANLKTKLLQMGGAKELPKAVIPTVIPDTPPVKKEK
jgi:lipid-binding SYLF domain-containing protein